jgi:hypothetical protein
MTNGVEDSFCYPGTILLLAKTLTKEFIKNSSKLYLNLSDFFLLLDERKKPKVFQESPSSSLATEMFAFPHARFSL